MGKKSKIRRSNFLFSLILAAVILIFIVAVYGQPVPCEVWGYVSYETGTFCGDGECTCNITNSTRLTIGTATTNATGGYSDIVNVIDYTENITVNCTGTGFWGYNYDNCTGGKTSINVTLIVPEYSDVEESGLVFPGFLIPIIIAASLCIYFIRGEDES